MDDRPGDRGVGELRVRASVDERRHRQGHRHGPEARACGPSSPVASRSTSGRCSRSRSASSRSRRSRWRTSPRPSRATASTTTRSSFPRSSEPDGKVLFDETGRPGTRVLDPDVAHCEVSILHGPIDDPSGHRIGQGDPGHTTPSARPAPTTGRSAPRSSAGHPDLVSDVWHGVPERRRTRRRVRSRGPERDLARLHDPGDSRAHPTPVPGPRAGLRRARASSSTRCSAARPTSPPPPPTDTAPSAPAPAPAPAPAQTDTRAGPDAAAGLSARTHGHGRGGGRRRRRRLGRRRTQRRYWPGIFGIVTPLGRFSATQLVTM